ncbi:MAG TPA: fatty acid desaturase [Candidatus Limnocylindrales bacterium]|nr:fatty acid desaturase [Candidatus Limnocylindrales bacterium]
MTAPPTSIADVNRRGRIPSVINVGLAGFYMALNLYQFFILPFWLLPKNRAWAWTLLPAALLTNPFWSLIHEAIHDLFHPRRPVNVVFGRVLAMLFGSPFRILRMSHLLHHKLNRSPVEGTEYYDRAKSTRGAAAPGYYFQIFLGLYLVEILSPICFLLPRRLLRGFKNRYVAATNVSALLLENWLGREALREIRLDGAATLALLALAFYGYGAHWPLLFLALLARGFLISFLDNVYHYETPVSDVFYAKNLRLAAPLAKLLLNFNFHGIHHVNPTIPWLHLPRAFEAQAGHYYGGYFAAALRQLRGPIALQDLPHGAAAARIRPA